MPRTDYDAIVTEATTLRDLRQDAEHKRLLAEEAQIEAVAASNAYAEARRSYVELCLSMADDDSRMVV